DQVSDRAEVRIMGAGSASLNGFSDTITRLTLAAGAKVFTDGPGGGGVLTVRELWFDGKQMPRGVYSSASGWLHGSGLVVVGGVKRVEVLGAVDDPNRTVGAGNIASLKGAATLKLPDGDCAVHAMLRSFPLTLAA